MSFNPAVRPLRMPMFVTPYSWMSMGPAIRGVNSGVPTSSVGTANRLNYMPFYCHEPYLIQRFFWLNGSTVGTDSAQVGIYTAGAAGPEEWVVGCGGGPVTSGANACQFVTPSVAAHGVIGYGSSTLDVASFTTASAEFLARPGWMYAIVIVNSKASAADAPSTVSTTGGALSFTSRASTTYGASTEGRVSLWTAVPTSDVTATVVIDFGANAQTGCSWGIFVFTHVDTATNDGIVQTATNTGNSATAATTLSAFGSANNATLHVSGSLTGSGRSPSTGYVEHVDASYATPSNAMCVDFRYDNDTTPDGGVVSGQWGAIGAEINSLGSTVTLAPGFYYLAHFTTGNTATFFRGATAGFEATGLYAQNSTANIGMPQKSTPAAVSAIYIPVVGFTNRASP